MSEFWAATDRHIWRTIEVSIQFRLVHTPSMDISPAFKSLHLTIMYVEIAEMIIVDDAT